MTNKIPVREASVHKTVLLKETIAGLNLTAESMVVDATFGGGGHSAEICRRYAGVKIIAFDQDQGALIKAKSQFEKFNCDLSLINDNFRNIDKELPENVVDAIIFDLGLSSDQLESSGRGFSFLKDEPLLMTMKENPRPEDLTAFDVVNTWEEENLAQIILGYGEERYGRKIARAIVAARAEKEIKTTFDLVKIISAAVPKRYQRGRLHYATRTFQAIRIAVNDELGALSAGLEKGFRILKKGGRIAVISFHSLEDRIVKRFYKTKVAAGVGQLINKKIILASIDEVKNNPRARSAKLRILEKI